MTSKLTRERIQRIIRAIDSEAYDEEEIREWLSSDEIMELSRMALAAMDSEPVAYIFKHPAGRLFWSLTDKSNKGHDDVMPVYASPQPAPIVEREPIAWLNDAYLARGVVDGEAGSEDAGPGYIPVYRHAQPAPVVPVVPVVPDFKKLARELVDNLVDCGGLDEGVKEKYLEWAEKTCHAAMFAAAPQENN
ncbi:hypothetical protein [Klebsiella pneumoniae]|uniref:hypothetical protein n=1 Tax=Klebsiella pneumoniae TaxID=573 RepID=UPI0014332A65|nr:hypothetical protein [Klebsiella pneumoniae]QIU98927.1 hypothetical protein HC645_07000 [Klebsiella pneumoniae]